MLSDCSINVWDLPDDWLNKLDIIENLSTLDVTGTFKLLKQI